MRFCLKLKVPSTCLWTAKALARPRLCAGPPQTLLVAYVINRDYYMAIFISYPISTRDTHISPRARWPTGPRADMSVSGWYGVWYENCHIIIYLSYIFLSDKFAYMISCAESKARPPSAPNVVISVFFFSATKPYHPSNLFFFFFFFFFFFGGGEEGGGLPGQKSRITHVTHYHTFCAPQCDMCLKAMLVSHMQNEDIF